VQETKGAKQERMGRRNRPRQYQGGQTTHPCSDAHLFFFPLKIYPFALPSSVDRGGLFKASKVAIENFHLFLGSFCTSTRHLLFQFNGYQRHEYAQSIY
jgi:hypothetical protein